MMDVKKYFDIILHPQETMAGDLKNAEMKKAAMPFAILGGLAGLVMGLAIAAGGMMSGLGALSLAAVIILPILGAIGLVLLAGAGAGLYFLMAKILGGTGTFVGNFYLNSRLLWPLIFANIIATVLLLIPFLGGLINFVWMLYSIYLSIVAISVANNISKLKALVAYLLPMIIIMIVLFVVMGSIIMGLLAGASAAGLNLN